MNSAVLRANFTDGVTAQLKSQDGQIYLCYDQSCDASEHSVLQNNYIATSLSRHEIASLQFCGEECIPCWHSGSDSRRKQEKRCCMKCVDVELREYELPKVDCVCCVEEGKEEPRALPWRTLHQQLT